MFASLLANLESCFKTRQAAWMFFLLTLATPLCAQKMVINEFIRNGTMAAGGTSWIEVVLSQDMTAAELNTYFVGDSNNGVSTRNGVYQFTNMGSIAATFKAGSLIVVSGSGGPAADATYNPGGGDYKLVLYTNGANITRVSAADADIAGADVIWVDTISTGNTVSSNGFAVAYGATGTFQANANVTLAAAPGNNKAAGLVGNTNTAGAWTAANWSTNINGPSSTPGTPNNTTNTTWISGLQTSPDATAPTVASSNRQTPAGGLTNAASVTFRVTFSEQLNALTVSTVDFTLIDVGGSITGESVTSVAQGANSSIWDVTVNTGSGAGSLRLDVLASATLKDLNGVALTAAFTSGQAYTIDRTAPTVSSIALAGSSPTNAASVQFSIDFSESVTGLATTNFSLSTSGVVGASVSGVSGSGSSYTITVNTGTGSGTIRLDLGNSTGLTDVAGNAVGNIPYASGSTYAIDKTAPIVSSINRLDASPTNAATVQFGITFSETVMGLSISNFSLNSSGISGASVTGLSGSGLNYTVTVGTGSGDGSLGLDLTDSTALVDTAGNAVGNIPFTGQSYTVDKTPPTATVTGPATPTNANPIAFTINFSETVSGLTATAGDITITNGAFGALTGSGSGPYTLTVIPSAQGSVTCQVNAGAVVDGAGNANGPSNNLSITHDSARPAVNSINRQNPAGANTNAASVVFRVTFSETLDGASVDLADFTPVIVSGTLSGPSVTNVFAVNGSTYDVTLNPGSGEGVLRLDVVAGTATLADPAGNALNVSFVSGQVYTLDATAPTVVLASAVGAQTNAAFNVTATFNESVSGFNAGGINVTNGTVSNFTGAGPYSWTVTPTSQGPVTVQVPAAACNDLAGNANANSNSIATNFDTIAPTVTQRTPDSGETVNSVPSITLQFNEAVTGVLAGALTVNGSAATGVTGSGGGPYVFTGFAAPADGTISVSLDGASIVDAAGNALGLDNYSFSQDGSAIGAILSSAMVNNGEATNASPVHFTLNFSRAVSGFTVGDISVANGTAGDFLGSGASYTFTITPSGQGNVNVQIPAGVANGAIAPPNPNAASNNYNFIHDTIAPTLTLTPDITGSTNAPFNVSVSLSEPAASFTAANLTVGNATINNFTGSGTTYSFTVNPTAPGLVSVQVGAGAMTDAAGNVNAASNLVSLTYDTAPPTLTLGSTAPDPTNIGPIPFHVAFSENVIGFASGDITVINGAVSGFAPVNGSEYDFTVTPSGADVLVTVSIAAGIAQDDAGNFNQAATGSISRKFDTVAPTAIVTGPASPTNGAPINFVIHFSEPVTGLTEAAISVSGGSKGVLSGSGSGPYILPVIPADEGAVTCLVSAGAASDAAGNANVVSNDLSITFDSLAPSVTVSGPTSPTNDIPILFAIQFSEPVTGFGMPGITVTGGVAGLLSGSGAGPYTLSVTPNAEGAVTCQVTGGAALDDAGNANEASNLASVTYDSISPTVASIIRQLPSTAQTNAASVIFRVTFSEEMDATSVNEADFLPIQISGTLSGGAVTGISGVDAATYDVTVNPGQGEGSMRLDVVAAGATLTDAAGNPLTIDFTGGEGYDIDTNAPTVTLDSVVGLQVNAPYGVNATFNEVVTGLSASSIHVDNGTVSDFSGSGAGPYSFTVHPTAQGPVSVRVPGAACVDTAGNASNPSNIIITNFDSIAPTITQRNPNAGAVVNSLSAITLSFSEPVAGISAGLLTVNGSAADALSGSGNGPYVFSGFAEPLNGLISVLLDGSAIIDGANNPVGVVDWTYDKNSATVTVSLVSAVVGDGGATNQSPIPFIATFSEDVAGLDENDIVVNGGILQNFSGSAADYTFEVAPTGEGAIEVQIPAGGCNAVAPPQDPNADSNRFNFTYDVTPPDVTIIPGAMGTTNGPFNVTITFSEPTTNFTESDVTLVNASLSNFTGSGTTYSFTATPTIAQDILSIDVPAGVATDAAGNPNTAAIVASLDVDSVAPTVSLVSIVDGHTVNVTFSEALTVAALDPARFTLAGSGKGTLSATPTTVTSIAADVYQLAWESGEMRHGGDITITVGGVLDGAGNAIGLPNAGTAPGAGLGVLPTVVISPVSPEVRSTPVGLVTLAFSETITGFDLTDLILTRNGVPVSLASLALTPVSSTVYSFDLTAVTRINGQYSLTVKSSGTGIADAAGNTLSPPSAVTWRKSNVNAVTSGWRDYE